MSQSEENTLSSGKELLEWTNNFCKSKIVKWSKIHMINLMLSEEKKQFTHI